jgi:hypothetical protein
MVGGTGRTRTHDLTDYEFAPVSPGIGRDAGSFGCEGQPALLSVAEGWCYSCGAAVSVG